MCVCIWLLHAKHHALYYILYHPAVHKDVLQRWKVDVLTNNRFIRSYESALKLGLCENLPHKQAAYYSANFLWQMGISAVVIVVVVYLGYRCRAGGMADQTDDIVYNQ